MIKILATFLSVILLNFTISFSIEIPFKKKYGVKEFIITESIYWSLHIVDWGQTRYIAKSPKYYELNPILGRNPSVGKVNTYFTVTGILHTTVSYLLWRYKPRWWKWFQVITITSQATVVYHNFSIGIKLDF